ncbi:ketopantoate reductase family protein [Granulicoccus sp. GXG6511]|uniref:ketopantoate reductase family protein n=1 Tax=Granulicoccus sp. GXG6511 TaxID=3381351 RepID=UPI003D7E44AE
MARYVILGTGAIGGGIGGRLAQAGVDVVWVARGEQSRVLRESGLTVRTPDETIHATAPVWSGPEEAHLTLEDVLVVAVKTQQVVDLLATWADVPVETPEGVRPAGAVLPIVLATNGVAAEDLALRWFRRVFGMYLWMPVTYLTPGEVIAPMAPHTGEMLVSRVPAALTDDDDRALLAQLERDWETAKLDVTLPDDVMPWKYRKLISNIGNVFEALLGPGPRGDLLDAAVAEARGVLDVAGIDVTSDDEEATFRQAGSNPAPVPGNPETGSSTWQSMRKGGSLETDYLNGEIAAIAARIGSDAPLNARLASLARRAAAAGRQPGSMTLHELEEELGLPG